MRISGTPDIESSTWLLRGGVLLILLVTGWSVGSLLRGPKANAWPARSGRLRVLTTIFPLYDFTREVGGGDVEVRNLLPPGVDPHEFALSPRDVELIDRADLLVANGAGLDHFLTEAIRKADLHPGRKPVVCSEGLPKLATGESDHEALNSKGHGEHQESGDPHLWVDPVFARQYVKVIASALAGETEQRGDGAAAPRIRERGRSFEARLAQLDADYKQALGPLKGRSFIAFHGAFAYVAARYGLKVAGVWQSTPGRDPAPREVGAILKLARNGTAQALFSEPQFSPRALEMIAHDANIPVYTLDPLETARDFHSAHYIPVMRANLKTLVRALGTGTQ